MEKATNKLVTLQTLEDLKNVALSVKDSIMLEYLNLPGEYQHVVDTDYTDDVYSLENDILAFVTGGVYYVMPCTKVALQLMKQYGFIKTYFRVICSEIDLPAEPSQKEYWNQLQAWKREIVEAVFADECETYCDEHQIRAIPEELLRKYCMEMPARGIRVKYVFQEKPSTHYPCIRQTHLNQATESKLGTYRFQNNTVVFIYRNGKTYVTPAYWMVSILEAFGFTKGNLFVPFCNDETILEDKYHQMWEKLKVVCAD